MTSNILCFFTAFLFVYSSIPNVMQTCVQFIDYTIKDNSKSF